MGKQTIEVILGALGLASVDVYGNARRNPDVALAQSHFSIVRPEIEIPGCDQKFQVGHMPVTWPAGVIRTASGLYELRSPVTWHLRASNAYLVLEDAEAFPYDRDEQPLQGRVFMND